MSRSDVASTRVVGSSLVTGDSVAMYVVIGLMGTINGSLAGAVGYALDSTALGLHTGVWAFLVTWVVTTGYLSYKRVPSEVLAAGADLLVLLVLLQPVALYGPTLVAATGTDGAAGSRLLVEGWRALVGGSVAAGATALVIRFVRGYFRHRAIRILHRRRKPDLWYNYHN
jgi:hypothetical protein